MDSESAKCSVRAQDQMDLREASSVTEDTTRPFLAEIARDVPLTKKLPDVED